MKLEKLGQKLGKLTGVDQILAIGAKCSRGYLASWTNHSVQLLYWESLMNKETPGKSTMRNILWQWPYLSNAVYEKKKGVCWDRWVEAVLD